MEVHDSLDMSRDHVAVGSQRTPSEIQRNEQQSTGLEDTTLNPSIPRPWHVPMSTISVRLWKQVTGLNPFKGSYFGLYSTLETSCDKAIVSLGVLLAVAAGVPLPIIGVIFGKIISSFPPDVHELQTRIAELLSVAVAYFCVTSAYTIIFSRSGERIAIRLRQQLFNALIYVDQAYLDVNDLDYNGLLRDRIDTIQVGCSEKVGIFLQSISYFVSAFTVGFILNAKLTGILFAAVIPAMVIVVLSGSRAISRYTSQITKCTERANATTLSALRGVQVVQAYSMIENICRSHREQLNTSSRLGVRKAIASALELGGAYFVAYAANGLAFYVGSQMAASDVAGGTSGTIYAVVFLILDASFVVGQFAPFMEIFARAASAYGKLQEILASCAERQSAPSIVADKEMYEIRNKDIVIELVNFEYPTRQAVPVLMDLNMVIRAGSFNAIVGTSGGGKSTLVSLLLRLYDYTGSIRCGEKELRSIETFSLRSQIAVLDQDCLLFYGTLYENVCHGLFGQDIPQSEHPQRCADACAAAGVDFLDDLPDGIHTRIDNTWQLSGGQRQRICLARAFISQPAVLILDEPTAALDARSESKVMSAIREAVKSGITVLMIAHRLSTVLSADHVTVLQDGRAVEQGRPSELACEGTVFSGLLIAQSTNAEAPRQENCFGDASTEKETKETIFEQSSSPKGAVYEHSGVPNLGIVLRRFLHLTKSDHLIITVGVLASIISGAMIIGEAIVFGDLVQLLNVNKYEASFQQQANFHCLMFFVLACIALVAFVSSGTALGIASSRLVARVQAMLLQNVLHLDISWFSREGHSASSLASTFAKDATDIACLSGVALGTVFTVIVSVLGGIILAHAVAWKIAVVLLSAVPVMLAAGFTRLHLLAKSEIRHRRIYTTATDLAVEICQGRKTVTTLGLEEFNLKRYHDALLDPYRKGFWYTVVSNTLLAFSLAITYFVYALAYWWGSKQVRNGTYSQQQFFTVLPALLFSAQSAGQLFSLSPEIARAKTAAVSVFKLLSYKPTILETAGQPLREKSPATSVDSFKPPSQYKIEFKSVDFSYTGQAATQVLQDVSFTIREGQTVALVGPSGSGKSSIIALCERFYDPTSGMLLFDGEDLRSHDIKKLRGRTALLPQTPELFPGSIRHNIGLGVSERVVREEEIERAAMQCGIHDFIASLPEGYATECGSVANSQLSGGQRQRIALARALLRDPEILLLDEPTSSLDAHSAKLVQDALKVASTGRTTIMVAHRLASVQHADNIIVMGGGKVVEQGNHAELVGLGGLYASMAKAQALT